VVAPYHGEARPFFLKYFFSIYHLINISKMESLIVITVSLVSMIFDHASMFLSGLATGEVFNLPGSGLTVAFALGAIAHSNISDGVLAGIRRWHGGIDDQYAAIDNLVSLIETHQPQWAIPPALLAEITENRNVLQALISRCRTNVASKIDREHRNSLLKSTTGICLLQVKIWAYGAYMEGVLTAEDVHLLGFLLPGESGGRHDRTEATDVIAEVKVKIINEDFIRVVVDRSAGENAAQVAHGWPTGVKNALIVITSSDGKTEVYRQLTTHLHNDIRMPEGSHGKQFIIKASFLKHVDDEPRFGNEPMFSMPLTTADLVSALDHQHHAEFEEQLREVERQRQEIERLTAGLNNQKK
jgi:hypothetical protein